MGVGNSKVKVPGVVYSEDWIPPEPGQFAGWKGQMYHVRKDTLPQGMRENLDIKRVVDVAGPEAEPYTFWERIGAVPISMSRIRPRQYYHPHTDFSKYDYDDQPPEEVELRAQWMARMFEFSWTYPMTMFCVGGAMAIPLPFRIRLPTMAGLAITVMFVEFQRVYANSAREKEMLDDFLVATEIWYIKNVETKEFGLDTLPLGMTGLDAIKKRSEEEMEWSAVQDAMVREGMLMKAEERKRDEAALRNFDPNKAPAFRGPGLESADGRQLSAGLTADGSYYAGEPGVKRPGQILQPRSTRLGIKTDSRIPDLPV
jgi:hypothetical protein